MVARTTLQSKFYSYVTKSKVATYSLVLLNYIATVQNTTNTD